MWIVQLALRRPYTFAVMALLILLLGATALFRTPTDIFPEIDIPVVTVVWTYRGMPTEEMEQRITTLSEYFLSANVNDIRRIESTTLNGTAVIKVFFHPGAKIEACTAQVTAVCQTNLYVLPPNTQPPTILRYSASNVPILQVSLSSKALTEEQVYDYGQWVLRNQLAVIPGVVIPSPYGGKERQVMVDIDPEALRSRGLSPLDVVNAVTAQNLTLPTGSARVGDRDYVVSLNSSPRSIAEFNDLPVRSAGGATVYLKDIAQVKDAYRPQTTVVRRDGARGALVTVFKNGGASTLEIVDQIRTKMPTIRAAAPKGLDIELLFDQSLFVRAAVDGVIKEGAIAGCLTAVMILLFLGSWRSTLIVAVSIPLSVLCSIILLGTFGYTLNLMTLGGLSLAVGILVDDATVEIENIHRNLHQGKPLQQAILDGAQQIAVPTFVSTLTICLVFVAVLFLDGPPKFLFAPLALAVVFAMMASYLLSRTLVPLMAKYLLAGEAHGSGDEGEGRAAVGGLFGRIHTFFELNFEALRRAYVASLGWALGHRAAVFALFAVAVATAVALAPFVGRDFFPTVDTGQLRLHVRAPAGARLEKAEEVFAAVEEEIRRVIPEEDRALILDNIGLPNRNWVLAFGDLITTGSADGEILIALKHDHRRPTDEYARTLRHRLRERFPDLIFFFQPADMVSQVLNFGLPAPIDVQIAGPDLTGNARRARELVDRLRDVPGTADVHLHQVLDAPELHVKVDRTRALEMGLTQQDVAGSLLASLSGSGQVSPNFWVDPSNGLSYLVEVRTPIHHVDSLAAINATPLSPKSGKETQLLTNVASIERRAAPEVVNHADIRRAYDVFANVQGRDLGGVAADVERAVSDVRAGLPPGNTIAIRGQVESMESAFTRLGLGLVFAAVLVYLLMVVNFQSWIDPAIILTALPGSGTGIVAMLFVTQTTFSVPSLMGVIMCVGVATANSILMVTFANDQRREGLDATRAVLAAGAARLRPVLMTALAMVVGMLPMSLGLGEGGEQNAPLGRAVIGGLVAATISTLFFVPVTYTLLRRRRGGVESERQADEQRAEASLTYA